MVKNIKRYQKQVRRDGRPPGLTAEDLDIIPATYVLPQVRTATSASHQWHSIITSWSVHGYTAAS